MTVSVEARDRPDGKWIFTSGYSSIDAAKAACREMRKNGRYSYRDMDFRIYSNDALWLVNTTNHGWRLRWIYGNGKQRSEQP